ncbi:MAG: T9SS C-terminal target domain-containing protein [Ignavibacteriae bacterium]|nr:MAG: T9SS C-terminal target domain-containing protein [Ignavibacteriota bacterium]
MKYIIISLLLLSESVFPQSGWFWQNPLPQGNGLFDIKMFNSNTGICINPDNLLRTTNGGDNWQMIYTGIDSYITAFSMPDENNGYILLDSTKIIKTVNGGVNWSFVSQVEKIFHSKITFTSPGTGFILGYLNSYYNGTKLLKTSNGGILWNTVFQDTAIELKSFNFLSSSTGFITGTQKNLPGYHLKIFKTTNFGSTWDSVQNNIFYYTLHSSLFIDNSTGFVHAAQPNDKILKTTDGGLTWLAVCNTSGYISNLYFIDFSTGFLNTGSNYYKTTNGGSNWNVYYFPETKNKIWQISFVDKNTGIGVGEGGLIAKTTNGGINWINKINSMNTTIWDISFSDVNTGFAAGDGGIIFKTTNAGINWIELNFPAFDDIGNIGMVNSGIWYFSHWDDGKILKTTNTGLTFDTTYANVYGITKLKFVNANTGFGVCKYGSFIKTTNGGSNWIFVSNTNGAQNWSLDFINENTGFTGGGKLKKTTNGGLNWLSVPGMDSLYSSDIQFLNSNTGFIGGSYSIGYNSQSAIWKTTDGGNSWLRFNANINFIDDIFFVNEMIGFAKHYNLIYKTINGGIDWFQIKNCVYNGLESLYFTDSITGYAVGDYGTIIKTTTGGIPIGIKPISNYIPNQFTLYQNYPNPFNPSTKIKFSVTSNIKRETSNVKMVIFDVLGREVTILVNEQLKPGTYEVEWNASDFASGVYFYSLIADGYLETRKMVLIK